MSNPIDERIVSMVFDTSKFQKNVDTTVKSLDNLDSKISSSGSSTAFEGLGSAVGAISGKFSAMGAIAFSVIQNITNRVINLGTSMAKSLTLDPIMAGFREYETQLNSIQTILANTQSSGGNLKTVNAALNELNRYADKTIFNFTEMTRNIGTFTAAGVKLDTSVAAIKGIANLAALSGSNAQQASTAMYQLSQALASGTVKLLS